MNSLLWWSVESVSANWTRSDDSLTISPFVRCVMSFTTARYFTVRRAAGFLALSKSIALVTSSLLWSWLVRWSSPDTKQPLIPRFQNGLNLSCLSFFVSCAHTGVLYLCTWSQMVWLAVQEPCRTFVPHYSLRIYPAPFINYLIICRCSTLGLCTVRNPIGSATS